MKYDNVSKYNAFMWNWSKRKKIDDGIFITSYINFTNIDELQWSIVKEW